MATVEALRSPATASHVGIRIQIGDIRRKRGADRLDDMLLRTRPPADPDFKRRVIDEITAMRVHRLGEACSELMAISRALAPSGHRIEPFGPPVSLMIFHLAGLTSLDPREHRLLTDAWPPVRDPAFPPAPWASPGLPTRHIGATVSMSPEDLGSFLRLRGYTLGTERLAVEAEHGRDHCFDRITAKQFPSTPDHQTLTVIVGTGTFPRLAAAVTAKESDACLRDSQTFHLLAAADTDAIGPLQFPEMKRLLRQRKPSSLEDLAAILATARDPEFTTEGTEQPLYVEDLMLEVSGKLGISPHHAKILHGSIKQDSFANQHKGWIIERALERGLDAETAEAFWNRLRRVAKNRAASSRATVLPLAHRCLRAAYLKAHYPEHFRTIVAAGRGH